MAQKPLTLNSSIMDIYPCTGCGDPLIPIYQCQHCVPKGNNKTPLRTHPKNSRYGLKDLIFQREITFYHADSEWVLHPSDLKQINITGMYSTKNAPDSPDFKVEIKGFLDLHPEVLRARALRPTKFYSEFASALEQFVMDDFGVTGTHFLGLQRIIKAQLRESS